MMATYFNGGSEFQAENLQTLYLMNPGFAATYSDAQLVGVPLAQFGSGTPGVDTSGPSSFHEIPNSDSGGPRFHYNLWGAAVNADPSPSQTQIPAACAASEFGFRRPSQQGLSLSLNNSSPANKREAAVLSGGVGGSPTSASGVSVGATASQSVILGSKYLKTVQQLLDEVVNMADTGPGGALREIPKATIVNNEDSATELSSVQRQELQMKKSKLLNMLDEVELRYKQYQIQMQGVAWALEQAAGAGTAKSYTSLALRTISKQFRCLKDAIATQIKESGRRLQEEEDDEKVGANPSYNRLRLVEKQLRQQQAMRQLGMMHNPHLHNVWRPQRGLPERAVSVLRAWLFEHFLHPYPKDSDKHMLAKQTGLTRSQVSNWFINARVRLWKPMVEEMYVEEMKGGDTHRQNDSHNANNTNEDTPKSTPLIHQNPTTPSNSKPNSTLISPASGSSGPTLHTVEPGLSQSMLMPRSPKRQRNSYVDFTNGMLSMEMKDEGLFTNHEGGFGPNNYPVSDHIGSRFNPDHHQSRYHRSGSAVSLTLGLPHSENLLSLSGTHHPQQNFLPGRAMQMGRRPEIGVGEPEWCADRPGPHSGAGVGGGGGGGGIDIQTRKTFAAPRTVAGLRSLVDFPIRRET